MTSEFYITPNEHTPGDRRDSAARGRYVLALLSVLVVLGWTDYAFAIGMLPKRVLSTNGSDRATRLVQNNKIVSYDDKTHVTWLDFDNKVRISTFNKDTSLWSATTTIGTAQDNHGPAALGIDSDSYLHAIYGPHAAPFQYAVSAQPNDSSSWIAKPSFGGFATYPAFVIDANDTIHLTYRGNTTSTYPLQLMYSKLPKGGAWKRRSLADGGLGYADYAHFHQSMAIGANGDLHLAYNIYKFDNPSPYDRATGAGYLTSTNGGATWKTIEGTTITQPVRPNSNVFFRTTTAPFGLSTNNIVVDSQNHPYISVWDYDNNNFSTSYLYHHDGTQWQSFKLNDLLPASAAGMRFNADFSVGLDAADGVYIAGNLNNSVAVLYSPNINTAPFELLTVDTAPSNQVAQGITIERNVGHNELQTPRISYYFGTDGSPSTVYSVQLTGPLDPQARTWVITGSGNWNTPTNWSPGGAVPNAQNQRLSFGPFNSAPCTVILDSSVTVNSLTFNSSRTYAIAGTGQITFGGQDAGILVSNGSHQLQVRTALAADASFDASVGSLEINNQLDLAGHSLTTIGNVSIRNGIVDSVGSGALVNAGSLSSMGASTIASDLTSVGELDINIRSALGENDVFHVLGAASLRGAVNVNVLDGVVPGSDYVILTAADGISLTGALELTGPDADLFSGLMIRGNSLVLNAAQIPEPAAASLLALGAIVLGLADIRLRNESSALNFDTDATSRQSIRCRAPAAANTHI